MTTFTQWVTRTRWHAWLFAMLVWACLYLPRLGELEVQGDEAKRILPAQEMLHTGDWLTPVLGSIKYYNKPPLIYWCVGGLFALTGTQTELVARLPSVLFIAAFVSVLLLASARWSSLAERLGAAILFLTVVSFVEKGRQIEIEAAFVSTTGMAIVLWLNAWYAGLNGWRLWRWPCLLTALGLLLKGPLIVLFFYAVVLCVLLMERRLRVLRAWPHILSVLAMVAPLVAWGLVEIAMNPEVPFERVWAGEVGSRFVVRSWHAGLWLAGIVKGIINYLPAALLLPCVWWRPWLAALPMAIQRRQRALRLALLLSFIAVSLLPGVRPRYYMPLFPLASILIATAVAGVPIDSALLRWWRRLAGVASGAAVAAAALALLLLPTGALAFVFARLHIPMSVALLDAFRPWLWPGIILLAAIAAHAALKPLRAMSWTGTDAVLITGVILTVIGLGVTSYAVPIKQAVEIRRPMGEALTARVPVNTRLTVYRSGYEPFYYYCLRPVEYCWRQRDLQPTMNRIVTLPLWITEVTNAPAVSGRVRHVELLPYRHKSFAMISCDGPDDAAALGEAGHRTTPVQ